MNRTQIAKFSMKTPNLRSESHSGSLVKPCWETNSLSQFSLGAKKQTFLVSKRIQKVGILVVLQTPSSTQSQERKNEKRRRISSKRPHLEIHELENCIMDRLANFVLTLKYPSSRISSFVFWSTFFINVGLTSYLGISASTKAQITCEKPNDRRLTLDFIHHHCFKTALPLPSSSSSSSSACTSSVSF